MLHILLLILKMVGIVLLILLGVLFLILVTVLFVPIRYRGQGSYFGKPLGVFQVSWLLHILSLRVSYREQPEIVVKIFGFQLFKDKEHGEKESEQELEPILSTQEVKKTITDPKLEPVQEPENMQEPKNVQKSKTVSEPIVHSKPMGQKPKKKNFLFRIAEKIKNFFRHLMLSFERFRDKLKQADNTREQAVEFLTDEDNKKTFKLIVKQVKKLAIHILPNKLKGNVTFGFEDPYITGQILTGAALFYPLYQKQLSIVPVFDRQIVEGDIAFKGRIRIAVILIAGLRILINKNFRTQLKKFMNRGGM